jgi:hypothetical protein
MVNKAIFAPTGGFGNHLRWLLLLDDQFSFTFDSSEQKIKYNLLKGVDWPKFVNDGQMPLPHIKQEIESYFGDYFKFQTFISTHSTVDDKLEFIKTFVYTTDRTWYNWLTYELSFKDKLHECILLKNYDYIEYDQTIVMTIDPVIAYKSYIKFNSMLNLTSKLDFLDDISNCNSALLDIAHANKNVLHLNGDLLYNKQLNKELYSKATQWFGLADHYDVANEVHGIWFNLHRKAEQEIIQDLNALYNGDSHG